MNFYEKLAAYSPNEFYNTRDKLSLYVLSRSTKAFSAAHELRDSLHTREDFLKYRDRSRAAILSSLGKLPYGKSHPLNAIVTRTVREGKVTVENIIFESRSGVFVTANLYLPIEREGKIPAVLFQPGHAISGKSAEAYSRVCTTICSTGIAVLAIDPIGQGERKAFPIGSSPTAEHQLLGERTWLVGESLTKYFLADAMRALDYLESRPEIDASRLGATGSSGGGTMTALLAALDDRIKAAAPGTFITDREAFLYSSNPQDAEQIWYGATAALFDHPELIACACPNPYLILGVKSDFFCIEGTEKTYLTAKKFYKLFDKEQSLGMVFDDSTHAYTAPLAEAAADFFSEHLLGKPCKAVATAPIPEELLRVTESGNVFTELPNSVTVLDENRAEYLSMSHLDAKESKKLLEDAILAPRTSVSPALRRMWTMSDGETEAEMLLWFSEERMPSYGILIKSKGVPADNPVTVCLWQGGTDALALHSDEIDRLLSEGSSVLIPDLVGVGKCTPYRLTENPKGFAYDARKKHHADLMFLGDSIGALFAYQLVRCIDMLRTEHLTDNISLYTVGEYGIYSEILHRLGYDVGTTAVDPVTVDVLLEDVTLPEENLINVMMYGALKMLK